MSDSHSATNIAGYKFASLDDLADRRRGLRRLCRQLGLRGTILLSQEGINLFVSGSKESVDALLAHLRGDPLLADLDVKTSFSDEVPFRRMLVKIKNEIVAFGVPGIDPARRTSAKLSPAELKRWLDEGRKVALLDVRNEYEVALGTFKNALSAGLHSFRQFPQAVRALPTELKDEPLVMFCTGGIRCEKAGPYMEREGFRHVFQLDGGILKYFEECGGAHFIGECFVFDRRVSLGKRLDDTETTQCFACQHPLSGDDQRSPQYVFGESCPYCYVPPEAKMKKLLAERQQALELLVTPLPGSRPYDNYRPMYVSSRHDHLTVIDFLDANHPHLGRDRWIAECSQSRILRAATPLSPDATVRAGDRIEHLFPDTVEPDVNPNIAIIHEDDAIVVVNKPAPLPMHPCGRFNRNTLSYILGKVYKPLQLRIAHRLDANTSGVVLLCKTRAVAAKVQPQFQSGGVSKVYLARIEGWPEWDGVVCREPVGVETTVAGARLVDPCGQSAVTEIQVVRRLPDGTSLVRAVPRTGRTNQIRIHLSFLGFPIVGEATYLRSQTIGDAQTLDVSAQPLCLHSLSLELCHPITNERVQYMAAQPPWARDAGIES
jgi:RluA family pseudouridine synthase